MARVGDRVSAALDESISEMNAKDAMNAMSALRDGNSRSIIWSCKNIGLGTLGWENDHRHSCTSYVQGIIYLKVKHACLCTLSQMLCLGLNLPESWGTYLRTS